MVSEAPPPEQHRKGDAGHHWTRGGVHCSGTGFHHDKGGAECRLWWGVVTAETPVIMHMSFQERIAKSHGTQCGFCTPGMVMSMYTLLRNHPQPSEEQLTEALGGRSYTKKHHHLPEARWESCFRLLHPTPEAIPNPLGCFWGSHSSPRSREECQSAGWRGLWTTRPSWPLTSLRSDLFGCLH